MRQKICTMFVLCFICALFTVSVKGGGLYGDVLSGGSSGVQESDAYLDTFKGPGSGPEAGLYGPAPLYPIAGVSDGLRNGDTPNSADPAKGRNYPPESAIDQFEVGYGGTYYRKGEHALGSGAHNGPRPNSNHIAYGQSGSSFDKPLDEYREQTRNPLDLSALNGVELGQLRSLAEAAAAVANAAIRNQENQHRGNSNGGVGGVSDTGPNIVANHGTLGPLLPKDPQDDKGLSYGPGGGASSSYQPLLDYGPGTGHGVLQNVLNAQVKLNALHTQILAQNLAKLNLHRHAAGAAYGPPGYNVGGYRGGPLDPHNNPALNLHPLFGKLEAVDANLKGKLQDKELQLANLEREKHALIAAAGSAALESVREKEKIVHLYGQFGIADALSKPVENHDLRGPGPGLRYQAAQAEKAAVLADKAAALADKAVALANHANGGNEYNPNFGPVPDDKVPLSPIRPLDYGPPNNPPPPPGAGIGVGPGGFGAGGPGAYGVPGNGAGGFGGVGNGFGDGRPNGLEVIHPIYTQPSTVKEVHNVLVKEQLKGQHYYGPGPGPSFAEYNGKPVLHGPSGHENYNNGLAPHQRPGPYPPVDELLHRQRNAGGYGPPDLNHKLDLVVENVAKSTAKALLGALKGVDYGGYDNPHNTYRNHH